MSILIALHAVSAVIWVGGMAFAFFALRPVAAQRLGNQRRLSLWLQVLQRFFLMVWASVVLLFVTGYGMVFEVYGGFDRTGLHVHLMHGLALVMAALFIYVWFGPYRRLGRAVTSKEWTAGGAALAAIRRTVAVNLSLGIVVVVLGSAGRYF